MELRSSVIARLPTPTDDSEAPSYRNLVLDQALLALDGYARCNGHDPITVYSDGHALLITGEFRRAAQLHRAFRATLDPTRNMLDLGYLRHTPSIITALTAQGLEFSEAVELGLLYCPKNDGFSVQVGNEGLEVGFAFNGQRDVVYGLGHESEFANRIVSGIRNRFPF